MNLKLLGELTELSQCTVNYCSRGVLFLVKRICFEWKLKSNPNKQTQLETVTQNYGSYKKCLWQIFWSVCPVFPLILFKTPADLIFFHFPTKLKNLDFDLTLIVKSNKLAPGMNFPLTKTRIENRFFDKTMLGLTFCSELPRIPEIPVFAEIQEFDRNMNSNTGTAASLWLLCPRPKLAAGSLTWKSTGISGIHDEIRSGRAGALGRRDFAARFASSDTPGSRQNHVEFFYQPLSLCKPMQSVACFVQNCLKKIRFRVD